MPRIPDQDSLGQRPVPRFQRSIATQRNRGGVADAAAQFGQGVANLAGQALEKQDKLAYATANAALLKADADARAELQDDPDYSTFETRYNERMAKARAEAGKLIQSRSDRSLFEANSQVDVARGLGQVKQAAHGKMVVAKKATLEQGLFDLQDVGQSALDEPTRAAAINSAAEMIDGAVQQGILDPQEAGLKKREFAQEYEAQGIRSRAERDDLEGARTLFERARGRLDSKLESQLEGMLLAKEQGRQAFEDADWAITAVPDPKAAPGTGTIVPSEPDKPRVLKPGESARVAKVDISRMVQITAGSESGNRERYSGGGLVTSPKGAQGRMQVMPATAADPGYGIRPWDGKSDADRSRVGEQLLAALVKRHGGNAAKAWASYNWDSSGRRVDQLVAKYGNDWLAHAPAETQAYVRKNVRELGGDMTSIAGDVTDVPDIGTAYGNIDARAVLEGWTPERVERAKQQVSVKINRAKQVENQSRDEAYERAWAKRETLGDNFTDVSQLGSDYYNAGPEQRRSLQNEAEANLKAKMGKGDVDPDDEMATALGVMRIEEPKRFISTDLRLYGGKVAPGKLNQLLLDQARMREEAKKPGDTTNNFRSGITAAIEWGTQYGGVTLNAKQKVAVYNVMESMVTDAMHRNKGVLTQKDYTEAFRTAVRTAPGSSGPNYEVLADIPKSFRDDFVRAWRGPRPPSEGEVITAWRAHIVNRRR